MENPLELRRFDPADADAVWDVHEAALRASPLAFVEEAAVDDDILEIESHYLDAGGEFLVGELDSSESEESDAEIVAIGGYLAIDDHRIEIRRMRVDPEFQRRGFAGEILAELERRAWAESYEIAELETVEPLRAARSFYEDAGYDVSESWEDDATGLERFRYRKRL